MKYVLILLLATTGCATQKTYSLDPLGDSHKRSEERMNKHLAESAAKNAAWAEAFVESLERAKAGGPQAMKELGEDMAVQRDAGSPVVSEPPQSNWPGASSCVNLRNQGIYLNECY
jgi:hypothetical protein